MHTLRKPTAVAVGLALALALLLGAFAVFFGDKPVSAQSASGESTEGAPSGDNFNNITPVLITKEENQNVTCNELDDEGLPVQVPLREFKVDPVTSGNHTDGLLTVNITTKTLTTPPSPIPGPAFDWTSDIDNKIGVDAVIVKGGPDADTYVYDPPQESKGDTNLHAPVNNDPNDPDKGKYYGLSHITFCYDVEPQVSKTADTSFDRTFKWTIDKTVSPAKWDLFKGDSGTSKYEVSVTKDGGTDSNWAVSGKITVTNPMPDSPMTISGIQDVVTQETTPNPTNTNASVSNCTSNGSSITLPYQLGPKASLECSYSTPLGSATNGTNKATATSSTSGIDPGTGTYPVDFSKANINKVNDSITVNDDFEGTVTTLGTATESKTFDPYERTFSCDGDEGTHKNTATIKETGQSDSASVEVNCYDLAVAKDATTSYTKTYKWKIYKSADKSNVTLPAGQSAPVNYTVKVDKTSQDSDFQATGNITVTNPAPIPAEINGVSDIVSPSINAEVDCGQTFPITVAANDSLKCTYKATLPDKSARTNTATASLQNHDYDSSGGKTASGTTDFSGTAAVDFTNAKVNEVDEQISVSDSLQGTLGTVDAANAPKTFTYKRYVGPYSACGTPSVPNTATFTTNDTGTTGSSSWTVNITVQCKAQVVKTVKGAAPTGTQSFTFQLRQGATTTANGSILESGIANAGNGGVVNFSTPLDPGTTYQLCEIVLPGWSTSLGTFVPGSFMPPDGVAPNPNVDNSILCVNFKPKDLTTSTSPATAIFKVDNTPPPGGRALTIGFWKNWASCSGGNQKPTLDQTLAKAEPTGGVVISATSGIYATFGPTYWLVLHGSTTTPNSAPDCLKAVRLLNKSTTDKGTKMSSDPAFNLAAQLLAAELNYAAGAGKTGAATTAINQAVILLGTYQFDGITHTKISAADAITMNNLAKTLDDYNNDR